jgi:hypothetical protein
MMMIGFCMLSWQAGRTRFCGGCAGRNALGAHQTLCAAASMAGAFATNPDGSAKDPAAYAAALRADPERVKALQARDAGQGGWLRQNRNTERHGRAARRVGVQTHAPHAHA